MQMDKFNKRKTFSPENSRFGWVVPQSWETERAQARAPKGGMRPPPLAFSEEAATLTHLLAPSADDAQLLSPPPSHTLGVVKVPHRGGLSGFDLAHTLDLNKPKTRKPQNLEPNIL